MKMVLGRGNLDKLQYRAVMDTFEFAMPFLGRQSGKKLWGFRLASEIFLLCMFFVVIVTGNMACRAAGGAGRALYDSGENEVLRRDQLARRSELLRLLFSDNRQARQRAALELLAMGDERSLQVVEDALAGPADSEVKGDILHAISFRGDRRCFELVLKSIQSPHEKVREAAAAALANYSRAEEIDAIIEYASSAELEGAQLKLIYRTMGEGIFVRATPLLIKGLESDSTEIKEAALESLRLIWDRNLPASRQAWGRLWEDNRHRSRSEIIEERLKVAESGLKAVRGRLADMERELEEFAGIVMSEEPQRPAALVEALSGYNTRVAEYAAFRLNRMPEERLQDLNLDDRSLYENLREAIRGGSAPVDVYIAGIVGKLQGKHREDLLLDALNSDSAEVLRATIPAVRESPRPVVVSSLESLLQHANSGVREAAANALSRSGEESSIAALKSALKDEEANVRWFAVESLRKLEASSTVPVLVELLENDPSPLVREISASTLGEFGQPAAFPALRRALEDDNRRVRNQVARALAVLAEKNPGRILAIGEALLGHGLTENVKNVVEKGKEKAQATESAEIIEQVRTLKRKLAEKFLELERYSDAAELYSKLLEESGPEESKLAAELRGELSKAYILAEMGEKLVDDYRQWLDTEDEGRRTELIREALPILKDLHSAEMYAVSSALAEALKTAAGSIKPSPEELIEEIEDWLQVPAAKDEEPEQDSAASEE